MSCKYYEVIQESTTLLVFVTPCCDITCICIPPGNIQALLTQYNLPYSVSNVILVLRAE